MLTAELLSFAPQSHRAELTLAALKREAPRLDVTARRSTVYQGKSDLLLLWGPGSPLRFEPMRQQIQSGRHVVAFDVSYWNIDRKVRVSIDAPHPQAWVMRRDWPSSRFSEDAPVVRHAWKQEGPVIIAGLGAKAKVQYGAAVDHWEAEMIAEVKARGWSVLYRPKKMGTVPSGVSTTSNGPIESVLQGASLVITWHSNVAIDAIRLGIPVVCRDGAAAAVCPSTIPDQPQPLQVAVRDQFLANLAWFQWGTSPAEARGCWKFLREMLA
jgi:hypothetical protein